MTDWQATILDATYKLDATLRNVMTLRVKTNFVEPGPPGSPPRIVLSLESVLELDSGERLDAPKGLAMLMDPARATPQDFHRATTDLVIGFGERLRNVLKPILDTARRFHLRALENTSHHGG